MPCSVIFFIQAIALHEKDTTPFQHTTPQMNPKLVEVFDENHWKQWKLMAAHLSTMHGAILLPLIT